MADDTHTSKAASQPSGTTTPNMVRFERDKGRQLFANISRVADGKGQFIMGEQSPVWNTTASIGCLENDAHGRPTLDITQIHGVSAIKDQLGSVLVRTKLGLENDLSSVRNLLTSELYSAPVKLTLPVDGLMSATGKLDSNVTVMDALCASPVIQKLRKETKENSK